MKYGTPFGRASVMSAALAAVLASPASTLLPGDDPENRISSARNGRAPGARMASIRAARKARNIDRHRAQCRG